MLKDPVMPEGMSVELIVSPGDIRSTFITQRKDTRLTLIQTEPLLTADFLNQSILMTFKEEARPLRIGFKVKVISMQCDHGEAAPPVIEVELLSSIEECDLRKYPRFNPNLFDGLCFSYGDAVLDLKDISAGGARATCRSGSFQELTKGEKISLNVGIGNLSYSLKAEVMRIKRVIAEIEYYEIAVAFMEWDRHFLRSQK